MSTTYTIAQAGNNIVLRQNISGNLTDVGFFTPDQINPIVADNAFRFENKLESFVVPLSQTTYATFADYLNAVQGMVAAAQTVFGRLRGPISDSFTRPNDTAAYAAGDAIQNATSSPAVRRFQNLFPAGGGSGYLSIAAVVRNSSATPRLRLHLFATDPATKVVDNGVFAVAVGDEGAYLGYIDLDAMSRGVACSSNRKEVVVAGTDLFYQVETLDGFTPAASTNYLFKATLDSNV